MSRFAEPPLTQPAAAAGLALLSGLVGALGSVLALGWLGGAPEPTVEREFLALEAVEIAAPPEPAQIPDPEDAPPPEEPTRPEAPTPIATSDPSALPPTAAGLEGLAGMAGLSDLPPLGSGLPTGPGGSTLPGGSTPAPEKGEIIAARPLRRPPPRYPARARREGIEGQVTVRLRVTPEGRVSEVVIVSAEPAGVFEDVARETARRYRFEPGRQGARAVATTVEQRILFRLQ